VPNIISVIVVGLLWQTIFSPHGPIAEVINSIRVREFQSQLRGIFDAAGGFSLSDDVVKRILDLVGPSGQAMFSDPLVDLRDFSVFIPW